jgi:predicted nuclease of restriction endonuclease-like RecB superfamily
MTHATERLQGKDFTFFPDFTVERGTDRVFIEIIRFHTWTYVQTRLAALREAGLSSVLLCVDDAAACSERGSPSTVQVFHFQKRVDVGRLLRAIERVVGNRDAPPDSDQPNS